MVADILWFNHLEQCFSVGPNMLIPATHAPALKSVSSHPGNQLRHVYAPSRAPTGSLASSIKIDER